MTIIKLKALQITVQNLNHPIKKWKLVGLIGSGYRLGGNFSTGQVASRASQKSSQYCICFFS